MESRGKEFRPFSLKGRDDLERKVFHIGNNFPHILHPRFASCKGSAGGGGSGNQKGMQKITVKGIHTAGALFDFVQIDAVFKTGRGFLFAEKLQLGRTVIFDLFGQLDNKDGGFHCRFSGGAVAFPCETHGHRQCLGKNKCFIKKSEGRKGKSHFVCGAAFFSHDCRRVAEFKLTDTVHAEDQLQ